MPNVGPLELAIVFGLFLWFLPSYFIARYAERKGHSFAGFLLLGLLVSWVISGIVALVSGPPEPRSPKGVL